jgi:ribosomal protein S14
VRNEQGELEVEHADRHHRVFLAKVCVGAGRRGGMYRLHLLCAVCFRNLLCL